MPPRSKSKKDPHPNPKSTANNNNNNVKNNIPSTNNTSNKINWPPLRPLVPSTDLFLTPLLHDQIYLIPNFFTANLCKTYLSFLASLPLTTTPGRPKKDEAVRVNDRFQIEDAVFAEMLWSSTALRELVLTGRMEDDDYDADKEEKQRSVKEMWGGEPLGLNSNIRVYRYKMGQFFAQHYDDANTVTFTNKKTPPVQARTTWTLLIYLSTCTGGETVFYPEPTRWNRNPEPISVAPGMGMALLHRHGDRCMLHEGKEVLNGEKWVLRSDLVVER